LNVAVLYSIPLVVVAAGRHRRLLWALAFGLLCMTFAVYLFQVPHGATASRPSFLNDRVLAAASILLTAGILDAWLRSQRVRDHQAHAIEQQNVRLAAVNAELLAHREEISIKNEELEQSRSEIEKISNRKTQMLASISHDIRSPIQAITLMAEVIKRTAEKSEPAGKIPALAQRLQANAISVVDLLSEIIDIASFDTGRITINNTEFDLDELIALLRERVLPMAESKGLDLIAEPSQLRLRTDRVKLGRAIGNLVGNAIKFTGAGSVTVSCGLTKKDTLFVRVADTGCGIKPADLDRIFAEFAQINQSPVQLGGGWGLGLAISRRMVHLLGGEIEVQSVPGQGSAFIVTLPPSCVVINDESAMQNFIGQLSDQ
jgi:signal transduction histidine kinase